MLMRPSGKWSLHRTSWLIRNLGLDEFGQQCQRLLPAEITRLSRNDRRHAFLNDVKLGTANGFLQRDCHLDFAGQVWVVKAVGV